MLLTGGLKRQLEKARALGLQVPEDLRRRRQFGILYCGQLRLHRIDVAVIIFLQQSSDLANSLEHLPGPAGQSHGASAAG